MTPETLQQLEDRLLEEIADTEERIVDLEKIVQPISPDKAIGRLSRLDAMQDKSVTEASLNQAKEKLTRLETALQRIYDPEFGLCVTCRHDIPIERLLLLPHATQCVACASS
ncbi:MAG: TraR/DksA C4-type zinc finger protein [Verrucomicrobiota bacterium]